MLVGGIKKFGLLRQVKVRSLSSVGSGFGGRTGKGEGVRVLMSASDEAGSSDAL